MCLCVCATNSNAAMPLSPGLEPLRASLMSVFKILGFPCFRLKTALLSYSAKLEACHHWEKGFPRAFVLNKCLCSMQLQIKMYSSPKKHSGFHSCFAFLLWWKSIRGPSTKGVGANWWLYCLFYYCYYLIWFLMLMSVLCHYSNIIRFFFIQ